jgi:hypothetical protein
MVKGELASELCPGFLTVSWNQWLEKQGNKGCLGDIPAHSIDCYITEQDYKVRKDGTQAGRKRRASILKNACFINSSVERQAVRWEEMAGTLLLLLYTFREALATIKRNYYKGEEVLFPDLARSLANLSSIQKNKLMNSIMNSLTKLKLRIDIESIKRELR